MGRRGSGDAGSVAMAVFWRATTVVVGVLRREVGAVLYNWSCGRRLFARGVGRKIATAYDD